MEVAHQFSSTARKLEKAAKDLVSASEKAECEEEMVARFVQILHEDVGVFTQEEAAEYGSFVFGKKKQPA